MADDIVAYLRAFAAYEGEGASLMVDAADEIERLRKAGDLLAGHWSCYTCEEFGPGYHEDDDGRPIPCPAKAAYIAWKEARRG